MSFVDIKNIFATKFVLRGRQYMIKNINKKVIAVICCVSVIVLCIAWKRLKYYEFRVEEICIKEDQV